MEYKLTLYFNIFTKYEAEECQKYLSKNGIEMLLVQNIRGLSDDYAVAFLLPHDWFRLNYTNISEILNKNPGMSISKAAIEHCKSEIHELQKLIRSKNDPKDSLKWEMNYRNLSMFLANRELLDSFGNEFGRLIALRHFELEEFNEKFTENCVKQPNLQNDFELDEIKQPEPENNMPIDTHDIDSAASKSMEKAPAVETIPTAPLFMVIHPEQEIRNIEKHLIKQGYDPIVFSRPSGLNDGMAALCLFPNEWIIYHEEELRVLEDMGFGESFSQTVLKLCDIQRRYLEDIAYIRSDDISKEMVRCYKYNYMCIKKNRELLNKYTDIEHFLKSNKYKYERSAFNEKFTKNLNAKTIEPSIKTDCTAKTLLNTYMHVKFCRMGKEADRFVYGMIDKGYNPEWNVTPVGLADTLDCRLEVKLPFFEYIQYRKNIADLIRIQGFTLEEALVDDCKYRIGHPEEEYPERADKGYSKFELKKLNDNLGIARSYLEYTLMMKKTHNIRSMTIDEAKDFYFMYMGSRIKNHEKDEPDLFCL